MRFRISARLAFALLALILAAAAIVMATLNTRRSQKLEQNIALEIPVTIKQLPLENGVVPVEMKCQNARLAAANSLEAVPCVIRNNTNKNIRALATAFITVVEFNGKESPDIGFLTLETFLHPDFDRVHMHKPTPPGGERALEPIGTSYDNGLIKRVEFKMDYVEFEDNTTLGPNENGSRIIGLSRDGAVKYKEWLIKKYTESGKSVEAIASLLQSRDLPSELGLEDINQRLGAKQYRNHLRDMSMTHGAERLEEYLNR